MRKDKRLMAILVAVMFFALIGLPVQAQNGPLNYGGIEFPLGNKSFVDKVMDFDAGGGTGESDGSAVIGPSDCGKNVGPSVAGAKGDVSLGTGGSITLKFTDNYLIDVKGLDLYVFEYGRDVEPFTVEISKDGLNWIDLGTVRGQPTGLDIHDKVTPGDRFSYVRITDANPYSPRDPKIIGTQVFAGADIDAVGAIGAEEKQDEVPNVTNPPASTPGFCDWTGTWETSWGKMELVQTGNARDGADVSGAATIVLPQRRNSTGGYKTYDGNIEAIVLGNKLAGNWLKPPSYGPPEDAGGIEFVISEDCNSFIGRWRHGYGSGKWDGELTGNRAGFSRPSSQQSAKEIVCASAKPRVADGSQFKRAWFTIGGSVPLKVRITSSAENFAIKEEYGRVVFRMTDGRSWGSLTLEPGTYILSCNGGGAMGLMSASVCVEFPSSNQVPPPPSSGGQTVQPDPKKKEKPTGTKINQNLSQGPSERIIVRPECDLTATSLRLNIGKKERFTARCADADGKINMSSIFVDEWQVISDEDIGFIHNNGIFKAGPMVGKGKIRATAKNQEGNNIFGVFPITVTSVPLVTFKGLLKLYDANGQPYYPGDVVVTLFAKSYRSRGDWNHGTYSDTRNHVKEFKFVSKTDAKGWFQFVVPIEVDSFFLASWYWMVDYPPTTPRGFEWESKPMPLGQPDSDEAIYNDPVKPDSKDIVVSPESFPCFEIWLKEIPVTHWLFGQVIHQGKPVKDAQVSLLGNYNNPMVKYLTNSDGGYELQVDNLPKGRYRLIAKYEPKKPSSTDPFVEPEPWQKTTVHNLLYQKNKIAVELPLKSETKTINIEMISFAQKIGYRERGVKGGSTKPPGVSNGEPSRSNSLEWNDRPWVIDNNNNNGADHGSGSGWEEEPSRRPGRDVIFDEDDRSGTKDSGNDNNVYHNNDTNWGPAPGMEPSRNNNFD